MTPIDEIERLRKEMLVGSKKGNRFLQGFSKSALILHSVTLERLWERLIESDQKLKVKTGIPTPMVVSSIDDEAVETDKEYQQEQLAAPTIELAEEADDIDNRESVSFRVIQTAASQSSLKRLMRKANEGIEERGFNFLNLCIGKVHWKDDRHTGLAPALLIPVRFVQTAVRLGISIEFSDEAIQWNPALLEKLRTQLPAGSVPEELFIDFSAGDFEAIEAGWEALKLCIEAAEWTLGDGFALNLLETSQIQMYRDLDTSDWKTVPKLIQQTLGTGFVVDAQLQSFQAGEINQTIKEPEALPLILDADSAQVRAVALAAQGGNLVIQGPPGTGKSQTIANIIATMVGQGKRVLFVAQKKAALDVVYQRLCNANLEHLLLELHSSKSKKSTVLNSLTKARNQTGIRRTHKKGLPAQTIHHRTKVEKINTLLQQNVGQSEHTLADIFSHAHQSVAVERAPILQFDNALDWNLENCTSFEQASIELSQLIRSEQLPWSSNPFRYVQATDSVLMKDTGIFDLLTTLRGELAHLQELLNAQQEQIGCSFDGTLGGVQTLVQNLDYLVSRPNIGDVNWTFLQHDHRWDEARSLISHGQALGETQKRLEILFEPTSIIQYKRIETLFNVVEQLRNRWWRLLHPTWWSSIKQLATFFKNGVTPAEVDGPIQELEAFHLKLVDFEEQSEMGGIFFGPLWKGIHSDWADLQRRLQWIKQLPIWATKHPRIFETGFVQVAEGRELAHEHSVAISKALHAVQKTLTEVCQKLQPLPQAPLSTDLDLSLLFLREWLDDVNLTRPALARGIAINQVCRPLREARLEDWITWLMQGQSDADVHQQWEHLLGHSRVQLIRSRPLVQRLTRSTLQILRNNYIQYDERLPMYAQEKLVAQHIVDVQSLLTVGQLAVLTTEMSKKRSRKSIRWLMANCGQAIQRLKPVMMMSPISVATHLPIDVEFDVVIFDEASQMTTPFALSALMRSKQAIVVGDSQQLSPTSFFQASKDMESILDRFVASGCPSIQLSFHYRSRHPSLISISNRYMYDGGLKPFPTPNTHPLARGIRLISSAGCAYDRGGTSTNPHEADLIVHAVAGRIVEAIQEDTAPSIGIVAFSMGQKEVLQDAWDKLLVQRPDLRQYCASLPEGETLFIKNLEDVQGDERDIIFVSVGYGLDAEGRFTHNFGPVGREGGDRRLNVLFSRARFEMVICANFTPDLITSDNKALQMLKSMLELSVEVPVIRSQTASGFVEDVCVFIEDLGYKALPKFGPTGNAIDIAVQDSETQQFKLAIVCEGGTTSEFGSTRHRERLFTQSLEVFGWPVYRVWSLPWYTNPKAERLALQKAIVDSVSSKTSRNQFVVERVMTAEMSTFDWVKTTQLDISTLDVDIPSDAQPKTHSHLVTQLLIPLLKQEGPLSTNMIIVRMCKLIPSRKTSRNKDAIKKVLRQQVSVKAIQTKYGFYWHPDSNLKPRIPTKEDRDFVALYPPHVLSFLRFYLNGSVEKQLGLNEMATLLMQLVGWEVITDNRLKEFSTGITQVCTDSDIQVRDGILCFR